MNFCRYDQSEPYELEFQLTILLIIGLPGENRIQRTDKSVLALTPSITAIPTKEVPHPGKPLPIPPGFSSAQDFPPLVAPQRTSTTPGLSTKLPIAVLPVMPAVPILPSQSISSATLVPVNKSSAVKPAEESVKGDKEIEAALETPLVTSVSQKSSEPVLTEAKVPLPLHEEISTATTVSNFNTSATDTKDIIGASEIAEKRQRPSKLDITAAKDASRKDLGLAASATEQAEPVTPSNVPRYAVPILSQPGTPATAVSQSSASPGPRQTAPRTIRVVQTPKLETPSRAATSAPSATAPFTVVSRQVSRQPSLASINQPGTPFNEVSDNASLTSTSISRPGSPLIGKVGTAPVRLVTKSQQKKERQARAKRAEESRQSEEPSSATMPEEPVQAPIIGRKKKTKKSKLMESTDSVSVASGPMSPLRQDDKLREDSSSANHSAKERKKTSLEAKNDAKEGLHEAIPGPETEMLSGAAADIAEKIRKTHLTAATIFLDLQKKGQIPPNAIDIFRNVPGINHRFDLTEADLGEMNTVPSITEEQHRLLAEGKGICVQTVPNKYTVILPDRQVLRGFTREQAERYLKLRQQTLDSISASSFRSSRQGIESWLNSKATAGLNASGEHAEPKTMTGADHGNTAREFSQLMTDFFATPMSRDTQLELAHDNFWEGNNGNRASTTEGLPVRQPTISVEEAERALVAARKETEALEKRMNGLLKKNRKLLNAH